MPAFNALLRILLANALTPAAAAVPAASNTAGRLATIVSFKPVPISLIAPLNSPSFAFVFSTPSDIFVLNLLAKPVVDFSASLNFRFLFKSLAACPAFSADLGIESTASVTSLILSA